MALPPPLQHGTCQWIANVVDLETMLQDLSSAEMLAVDVEHHHIHSYLGFVCLLQLSTGKPLQQMRMPVYLQHRYAVPDLMTIGMLP